MVSAVRNMNIRDAVCCHCNPPPSRSFSTTLICPRKLRAMSTMHNTHTHMPRLCSCFAAWASACHMTKAQWAATHPFALFSLMFEGPFIECLLQSLPHQTALTHQPLPPVAEGTRVALKRCGCNLSQTVGRARHVLSSKRGGAVSGRWSDGKMYVSLGWEFFIKAEKSQVQTR